MNVAVIGTGRDGLVTCAAFWYYPTGRPPILQYAQRSDASPSAVGAERPPALAGSPGSEIEWS
ncbi:MAG TPA: hypothetical protein VMR89_05865 [Actinomycetota bacterium]|nr:hypothetical protein [Actinomycetota bacterium]